MAVAEAGKTSNFGRFVNLTPNIQLPDGAMPELQLHHTPTTPLAGRDLHNDPDSAPCRGITVSEAGEGASADLSEVLAVRNVLADRGP